MPWNDRKIHKYQVSEHFQQVAEFVQQYYPPVDIDRVLEIPHFPLWN